MEMNPIANHKTLPDMPSSTNTDHDGRYLSLDGTTSPMTGTIDMGNQNINNAKTVRMVRLLAGGVTE